MRWPVEFELTHAGVDELQLVGGERTLEGRQLVAGAAAAGLTVRWLSFDSMAARSALAAQGPGAVRLPLAIVGGTYTLQRPEWTALRACVSAMRTGDHTLPTGAVSLRDDRPPDSISSPRSGATRRRRR